MTTEYEMERLRRENEALKKKLREEALFGFMAGRVGKKYGMWAAGEM